MMNCAMHDLSVMEKDSFEQINSLRNVLNPSIQESKSVTEESVKRNESIPVKKPGMNVPEKDKSYFLIFKE